MTTGHKLHGGPTRAAAGPADRWSPHGANAPEPATVSPSSATSSVPCSAHSVNAEAGRKPTVRRAFAASVMTRASARSSGAGRVSTTAAIAAILDRCAILTALLTVRTLVRRHRIEPCASPSA
jgi:hypothetical protein